MKKVFTCLLLAFFSVNNYSANANSCNAPDEKNWIPIVQEYLGNSKAVFLGEVIAKKNKSQMWVKVIEVFKGTVADTLIFETHMGEYLSDDSDLLPWPLGVNIFYADNIQDKVYEELLITTKYGTRSCGLSRSLTNLLITPPIRYTLDNNEIDEVRILKEELLRSKNWINEYALLNAYRNNHHKPEVTETNYKDYLSFIAIALSLLAVLIVIFKKQA